MEINKPEYSTENQSGYLVMDGYWCRYRYLKSGERKIKRLCNFTARIVRDEETKAGEHFFTIEGELIEGNIPLPPLRVPAGQFAGMSWVRKWGCRCFLEPGGTKDYVRHAILKISASKQL